MDKSPLVIFIPILFPIFFVGLWCGICMLISRIGGWHRLAAQFATRRPPSGSRFIMEGGRVGWARYRGCLTIYTSPDGLYLSVWLPFRPGHPPLLIPWAFVRNVTTRQILWTEVVSFDVGSPSMATLQLSRKIFEGHDFVTPGAIPAPPRLPRP